MRFHDRRQAGRDLAGWFLEWPETERLTDVVVLALVGAGTPAAAEVAGALHAPLDVLVVRKIGLPGRPDMTIGALVGDEPPVFDREKLDVLGITEDELAPAIARERSELHRREHHYRKRRPPLPLRGRTVILVDDGLATGSSARAALIHLRHREPARLLMAVPVASPDVALSLRDYADSVICLHEPEHFRSVGQWYEHHDRITDAEVVDTLRSFHAAV
jgi:putative phosphoribosyl transferase